MNADTYKLRQVTTGIAQYYYFPSWSPDGRMLAVGVNSEEIKIVDVSTGVATTVANGLYAVWSPDNQKLAVYRRQGPRSFSSSLPVITIVRPDGTDEMDIFRGEVGSEIAGMAWSPASDKLAFGLVSTGTRIGEVDIIDLQGALQRIPTQPGFAIAPTWSPQGGLIAYVAGSFQGNLVITSVDGTCHVEPLGAAAGISNSSWSPDGKQLAFEAYNATYILDLASVPTAGEPSPFLGCPQ